MRVLASTKVIDKLEPIQGADNIELATVGGWKVVVAKNANHKEGNIIVYCEIDSFLPIEPEFEFLRKSSYTKLSNGTEGFRLKTIKLRGQISQGLIIPLKDAISVAERRVSYDDDEALKLIRFLKVAHTLTSAFFDVTELLGISKWDPPLPAQLSGIAKGSFPGFIEKTDEERIQNLSSEYEHWKTDSSLMFYATEKLDGSSVTFYIKDGEFGVCSRNLELLESEENSLWKAAKSLKIEEKLRTLGKNIALQGEIIGEGIQKNHYKLKGQHVKFFTAFDIDLYKKVDFFEFARIMKDLKLETVPYIVNRVSLSPSLSDSQPRGFFKLPNSIEDLLSLAEKKSTLEESTWQEGLVIRSFDNSISFKVISNKFLLKDD